MKLKQLSILSVAAMMLASCASEQKEEKTEEVAEAAVEQAATTFNANTETSKVYWLGDVIGAYQHEGFVNLNSGTLTVENGAITAGTFEVDMTHIYPTDTASYKPEDSDEKGKMSDLVGHLSTGDFFNTAEFPTATFEITTVEGSVIKGNLTVRGKTHEETLNLESFEVTDGNITAKGKLVFDRQKYDVAWVHYMKDMVLSDDIALNIELFASE